MVSAPSREAGGKMNPEDFKSSGYLAPESWWANYARRVIWILITFAGLAVLIYVVAKYGPH
jgi:hypothetical protein